MKIWIKILIIIVVLFGLVYGVKSYINPENDDKEFYELKYSEDTMIQFIALSFDEFINKLQTEDIRSVGQTNNVDWEQGCFVLFDEWYKKGSVPLIPEIKDRTVYSFVYDSGMPAIGFKTGVYNDESYYEIIPLNSDIITEYLDIELLYCDYYPNQNEILNEVGGEYQSIIVNGKAIKVAVTSYESGTCSMDFVWDNKYLVRMWDKEELLRNVIDNFGIEEININQNALKNFLDEVPNQNSETDSSIGTSNVAREYRINEVNNKKEFNVEICKNMILESTDILEGRIPFNRLCYRDINNNKKIVICVSEDVYSIENILSNMDVYLDIFNSTNPYRYDQSLIEQFGIYKVTSGENKLLYEYDTTLEGDTDELILKYEKEGYKYSEIIIVREKRIIKLYIESEMEVGYLNEIASKMEVY